MSHVIDARGAGGELVVIGKALVLPNSDAPVLPGAEPLIGALRYNPAGIPRSETGVTVSGGTIEVYLPHMTEPGVYAWNEMGVTREDHHVMYSDGATMDGRLKMVGAQILLDDGSASVPGLAFVNSPSTGLYRDDDTGTLRMTVLGVDIVNVGPAEVDVLGLLTAVNADIAQTITADTGKFNNLYANYAYIRTLDNDTLNSNVGFIKHLTSNLIDVVPAAGADPNASSDVVLIAAGTEWVVSHEPFNHDFTVTYEGTTILTLTTDDTLLSHNIFASNTTTDVLTANTINAKHTNTGDLTANTVEASNSVTTTDLVASNSVTTNYLIANINVHTTDLLSINSVVTTHLIALADVATVDLVSANSVTTTHLIANADVQTTDLRASNSVTTTYMNAQAVSASGTMSTTDFVAANSVTTSHLIANADIQTIDLIAANSVTTNYLTANINVHTVDLLSTNSVTTTHLVALGDVLTPHVNATTDITTPTVTAGTITASTSLTTPFVATVNLVATNSIQTSHLAVNADVTANTVTATGSMSTPVIFTTGAICETYLADAVYPVGTVLKIGGNAEVTISTVQADSAWAGVVASAGGTICVDAAATPQSNVAVLCLSGRTLCRVVGNVAVGDLLITSNVAGCAQTAPNTLWGADIIGRALYPFTANTDANGNTIPGTILIKVS